MKKGSHSSKTIPYQKSRGGFYYKGLVERARKLRANQTPAEEIFWQIVRNRKLGGMKFRRQHQINRYIVDFYCVELGLIIELDGDIHDTREQLTKDSKRDKYLTSIGNTIIRIPNQRIFDDIQAVLEELMDWALKNTLPTENYPSLEDTSSPTQ